MDKKESLAFLQSCIDRVNSATSEEIKTFQNIYASKCLIPLVSSEVEFLPPVNSKEYSFEKRIEVTFSEKELALSAEKVPVNYYFEEKYANNRQENNDAAFAA